MRYSFRRRWSLKAGSLITQEAVFKEFLTKRFRVFIVDVEKRIPNQFHQYIDWDQSRKEQVNWPTKTIVNMRFKNETDLATMIGLLKV